jgi:predicted nuclease of predicted toxin-antitoxin system
LKLKLDENIPTAVAVLLRGRGIDTDTVIEESLGGHSDPAVLDPATQENRLLITLDRGFGDIRAYPPGSHPGIVVLRPDDQRVPTVTNMVETLIDNHSIESLAGCVTVVQRNMLRVRSQEQPDSEA